MSKLRIFNAVLITAWIGIEGCIIHKIASGKTADPVIQIASHDGKNLCAAENHPEQGCTIFSKP